MNKECFGPDCINCKEFFYCSEHFPIGCWGEEDDELQELQA